MNEDHWGEREDDFNRKPVRQSAKGIGWIGVLVVVAVVVFGAIGVAVWGFGVGTSDVKGRGDAEVIKNEAKNRIRAQEGFWVKYEGIVQADKNLNITAEALAKDPNSVRLQVELNGQKMVCNDLVGQYNAASQKFSEREFKDAELPHQIDDTSPSAIDCKENTK